jgi:hypothetical protein
MSGEAPEINIDEEVTLEDFVSRFFPDYELESVVMPATGERITYVDGKEQAQPPGAVLQPGPGDIQGAGAAPGGHHPEAE